MKNYLIDEFKKTRECTRYNNELETIVYTEEMLNTLKTVVISVINHTYNIQKINN